MSVPTLAPNNQLNIQGVHASNISSTPILSSYPSSSTSSSLGLYHFLDNNNASNHLNVSSSSNGGHSFSHASATQAPLEILKVDRTGMTLNTRLINSNASTYLDLSLGELKLLTNRFNNSIKQNNIVINDTLNNLTASYDAEQAHILNNSTNSDSRVYGGQVQIGNNVALNDLTPTYLEINNRGNVKSRLTKENLSITDICNNVAVLSSLDLTFNGVSVFNNIDVVAQKQVVPQLILSSPAIYADSSIAPQPSQFLATYGYNGWGYTKASPQASNAKINWYLPFPIFNGTVGQLKGLYYQIFNACVGSGDLPFIVVYTKPTGSGDYASWYHSSCTYVPLSNSPANQTCQMFMNIKNLQFTPQAVNIQNQINMASSTVNNPKGDYQDDQQILFISFQTNSASALNNVNFVCNKIGMITDNFSTEFLLM